jgi:hypothetical protein
MDKECSIYGEMKMHKNLNRKTSTKENICGTQA